MDPAEFEAFEARASEFEARMAAVPTEEVERYKALTFEEVSGARATSAREQRSCRPTRASGGSHAS